MLDEIQKRFAAVKKPPVRPRYRQNQSPSGRNDRFLQIFKLFVRVLLTPFFRIEVAGVEHLPGDRAFVLLTKHQRWADIPLISLATPRPLYYIAKYELFKNVLSNRFFNSLGGIPINRQRPLESRRFLQATIELLKKGEGVVIFPEGTYYRNKMGPGQIGMVRFVLSRLTLPFIPVGINYATGGCRIRVRIHFGKAFHAEPALPANIFVNRMMKQIADLSGLAMN
jgi:1-acyl-sn-glycerol-3-phosphate acyltransferase